MKALYKMFCRCGRMGDLEGIFVADKEDVKILVGEGIEVYFGEVLGKHSEIVGAIEAEELTEVTDDPKVIDIFEQYKLYSGFNPFNYSVSNYYLDNSDDTFDGTVQELVDYIKAHKEKKDE